MQEDEKEAVSEAESDTREKFLFLFVCLFFFCLFVFFFLLGIDNAGGFTRGKNERGYGSDYEICDESVSVSTAELFFGGSEVRGDTFLSSSSTSSKETLLS